MDYKLVAHFYNFWSKCHISYYSIVISMFTYLQDFSPSHMPISFYPQQDDFKTDSAILECCQTLGLRLREKHFNGFKGGFLKTIVILMALTIQYTYELTMYNVHCTVSAVAGCVVLFINLHCHLVIQDTVFLLSSCRLQNIKQQLHNNGFKIPII